MTIPSNFPNSDAFEGYSVSHPRVAPPRVRGVSFPLQVTGDGKLKTSDDLDLVRDHIFHVLYTENRERVMRPAFGLPDYIFDSLSDFSVVYSAVRSVLKTQVRGVDDFNVTGRFYAPATLQLKIEWEVSGYPQEPLGFKIAL